jgi:polyisoprenoid-binding protein YceI
MSNWQPRSVGWFLASLAAPILVSTSCLAEPQFYKIDSSHTYPSFEADHMGGLSLWRGKINSTTGSITLDTDAQTGDVQVNMDMTSIDFGHIKMNDHAKSDDMFDVERYPVATYTGQLVKFVDDSPTAVEGQLTLHGITKPVNLTIKKFKCMLHPMKLRRVCGADAYGSINRSDFEIDYAKLFGFDMDVALRISVEALAAKE